MSFQSQQENWEALAETDPLWAVLSEPDKRGGKWDVNEFYVSGQKEADDVRRTLQGLNLSHALFGTTLDVGCGPGRMTHAFTSYGTAVGYDISPRMIEMAEEGIEEYEEYAPRESYVLNETNDLSPFDDESFDFVYCSKVLQHVDPDVVGTYMAEMVRVLKTDGVLFLQMLSHPTGWVGSKESAPDPDWGRNGEEPPHYTVISVSIEAMMAAFLYMNTIIHQARLVEGGKGQSIFSYDYIVQKRGDIPKRPFAFGQLGTFNEIRQGPRPEHPRDTHPRGTLVP